MTYFLSLSIVFLLDAKIKKYNKCFLDVLTSVFFSNNDLEREKKNVETIGL